jgi:TfoX/Sxy family transcriptional regulator of competence genes
MSYYKAPEEVYDDREKAAVWATLAYEAALKQSKKKHRRKKK